MNFLWLGIDGQFRRLYCERSMSTFFLSILRVGLIILGSVGLFLVCLYLPV